MNLFQDPLPRLVPVTLDAPPLYRENDKIGLLLAYVSLMPAFNIFYRGSLLYHERDWRQLESFVGAFANAVLSKVLKMLVKIPRPEATCEELGLCGDLGMPSTHSQIMSFAFVSLLLNLPTPHRRAQSQLVTQLELLVLAASTAAVAWSRVYLGYHDVPQIMAGLTVGALFAGFWKRVERQNLVRKVAEPILRPILNALNSKLHAA